MQSFPALFIKKKTPIWGKHNILPSCSSSVRVLSCQALSHNFIHSKELVHTDNSHTKINHSYELLQIDYSPLGIRFPKHIHTRGFLFLAHFKLILRTCQIFITIKTGEMPTVSNRCNIISNIFRHLENKSMRKKYKHTLLFIWIQFFFWFYPV